MPNIFEIRLTTTDGSDAICLLKDQNSGEFFCPVCGVRRTFAPYSEGIVGSQDICLCCDFQYGCDEKPGRTCQESWEAWRNYWLETEHHANWCYEQLGNIGIDLSPPPKK